MCLFRAFLFLLLLHLADKCIAQQPALVHRSIKMPLSDGVLLDNDLYLPDTSGSYPVILIRTPYGKHQFRTWARHFAASGFGVLVQDVRGKFGSGGAFVPFVNEKQDGLQTLSWIADQRWCNGRVGGFGTSYIGFCSLTLADAQHPALKALFATSGWVAPGKMTAPGGAMHLSLAFPWLLHEEAQRNRNLASYDLDSLYRTVPLNEALARVGVESKALANEKQNFLVNEDFDYEKVRVPIFSIAGAFDFVKEASVEVYAKSRYAPRKLVFGPWFHNQEHSSIIEVGEEDFGKVSMLGDEQILQLATRWFAWWLKGEQNGIMDLPQARVFVMFADKWMDFGEFPPRAAKEAFYYLSSKASANSSRGDGMLSTRAIPGKPRSSFRYDPSDPVPTHGGANFHFFPETVGIKDQREIELRNDILVFSTEPLEKEMTVIGPVKVQLYAATEGSDTDFTAKLVLVDENGYARNICDGIMRARYRHGLRKQQLLRPGKVYAYDIDLRHTAFAARPGQRLRVEISSSNFPKYNRNFNTATDPFAATRMKAVQQTVFHSRKRASALILPIVNP